MNTHMLSVINSISHFIIGDSSFPSGSPYIYDLDVKSGNYRVVILGNDCINEVQLINVIADDVIPEWIEIANNIHISSGTLSIRASAKARDTVNVRVGLNRKCCGTIFCLEKDNAVIGIRIKF